MPWSIHTTEPTAAKDLRASLGKARDLRLRGDERSRILAGVDTDEAEVAVLRAHVDRAIEAAVALAKDATLLVQVSLSGDVAAEGVEERTTVSIDVIAAVAPVVRAEPVVAPIARDPATTAFVPLVPAGKP